MANVSYFRFDDDNKITCTHSWRHICHGTIINSEPYRPQNTNTSVNNRQFADLRLLSNMVWFMALTCSMLHNLFLVSLHIDIRFEILSTYIQAICQLSTGVHLTIPVAYDRYIDGFVQYCSNSIANTLQLLQFSAKPSLCYGRVNKEVEGSLVPFGAKTFLSKMHGGMGRST